MRATAIAPANIALIKYWGRKDAKLRLPYAPSISMNLSACTTTTTVELSDAYVKDTVEFDGGFTEAEVKRVIRQLDLIRKKAGSSLKAHVTTKNSFPKSAGIASSASGFAALTLAAAKVFGLKLSQRELTKMARLGSGSACRSIPDGFVKWKDTYAYSLYPHGYWDLRDILVIVRHAVKDVSSSAGHDTVQTSPYFAQRLLQLPARITRVERALKEKNFRMLGEAAEEDCLDMHHVMQTQRPALMYWNDATKVIMNSIVGWRASGIPVYFTIDAGPNVHILCEANREKEILKLLGNSYQVIVNKPAEGAHIL